VIVMDAGPVDLARARREAKALLRAARNGDAVALARVGTATPQLADAQLAIARELGARSWPALVRRVERGRELVQAATTGRRADAEALLDPILTRDALDVSLVLGDAERVTAALAVGPGLATRAMGAHRWQPLLYVTYSAFLGDERTDGLLACARALLDAGADPNAAWEDAAYEPMTALHGAAGVANEPRMTALLLEHGADPDDGTSLRLAAGADDPACLELLLGAGATPYRSMALAHAAQRGALRTARVLLERGPERWGERENALLWAARGEAPAEMLRLLVEHGADLEASFDGTGRTPYGIAVRSGRRDLAEVLASLGAQRLVEPLDELVGACLAGDAASAKRLAAEHPEAARLLRASEADVLARAAARGQRAAVEALLDLGVPVDARGPSGETALQAARECGHAEIAALLVERGADPRKSAPKEGDRDGSAHDSPCAELAWTAETAHLRILSSSPLAEARPCGDGFAVITGIEDNAENGVVASRAGDDEIADALAWFAERGAPAQWFLADPVDPPDLRERLVAAGASPERTGVVMGAELDRLALDTPLPPGLAVVAVRDAATLARWRDVARECLFDDADQRTRILESLGLGEEAPVQHCVAMRGGRPVGAASFFVHGEIAYGQHLGVLAPERRSGVGRALAEQALLEARAAGAKFAVLGPTPDTIAFYRLLGFVLRPYLRDRSFYLPLPEG
jgi:ankyrin repeat protein/GNAT superfamily N-acetyltransferase